MLLAKDPSIGSKIRKMHHRVAWQHPRIVERNIDQTRLFVDDGHAEDEEFSFLVLGDSGTGRHYGDRPQRRVAEALMAQGQDARFVLHTGDVVYLVGSSEQYFANFINPYREWLVGGETPKAIPYDRMVFQLPFFPTLGNHDYFDLSPILGGLSVLAKPIRRLLRRYIELDVGCHGSFTGDAYARAFMDYLHRLDRTDLETHLDRHYTATGGTCLSYVPGEFTRIPNRYYRFRYGGIDFFALDSNTFNEPEPLQSGITSLEGQKRAISQQAELNQTKRHLLAEAAQLDPADPDGADRIDDIIGELQQMEEEIRDISKRIKPAILRAKNDVEQLHWLQERLIESWRDPESRGRILYFHHPPYVTEASKCWQSQTIAVRHNLRQVLAGVRAELGTLVRDRPLVDLIISGHAHCFEYLRTADSPLADANIPCLVCGGSGYSLRRQRKEGPDLFEEIDGKQAQVATSQLFIGRQGRGRSKRRPYSGLHIEIEAGKPPSIIVHPIVVEKFQHQWQQPKITPLIV
ncbi:MAG: metallophosphoesterase [Synechococcus sp.]